MSPEEIRQRGEHARQLLEDELLRDAFDHAERQVMLAWENTKAGETEQREQAFRLFKAVKIQRGILIAFLREGKDEATVELRKAMALKVA
jgi:hypothetical protein